MNFTRGFRLAWHACLMVAIAVAPMAISQAETGPSPVAHHELIVSDGLAHAQHAQQHADTGACHTAGQSTAGDPLDTPEPETPDAPPSQVNTVCVGHCLAPGAVLPTAGWKVGARPGVVVFIPPLSPPIEARRDVDLRPPIG